jgi:hypothetical protein
MLFLIPVSFSDTNGPIISELMAINNSTLADEDGDFSDWIEIHNPGTAAINLDGWFLTDNPTNIPKWRFPAVSLGAGEYLVVFASEKDKKIPTGKLHTNFKLSGSGEFLALVEPDGTTLASSFGDGFPAQKQDESYGLYGGQYIYLKTPTPGATNDTDGSLITPILNQKRGFYTAAFQVSMEDLNDNSDIYYTVNGSSPTLSNGTKYVAPITIDKTTVLSAVAIDKTSQELSAAVTQSYFFIDDILSQPNNPQGYPSVWGQGYPGDYEMDPEICTPENKAALDAALKSLPTVSLVLDVDYLFRDSEIDSLAGIYLNSTKATEEWERPASIEYFDPATNLDFQLNCGLRVHGGNGRKPGNSPKHSFRVSFRSEYGPSKLNFNMFDEKSATNEFNSLVLRAGYNYSWLKNSPAQCEGTDYIRDPFTKKTQLDMDREAAHTKFAHLYVNGIYWGVYNISEKITNDFAESYLGGKEDDYDVVKDHVAVTDGNMDAWNALLAAVAVGFESNANYQKLQGKNEDGSVNDAYQNLLDVRNFTDYMIINYFIGNGDWDRNNWLAIRNRVTNKDGFSFYCWDAETSMNDVNENIVDINNPGNPSEIFTKLMKNKEYKLFFADRVQKHFYNGGALTTSETEARYMEIANTIGQSMLAESARWGDYRRDADPAGNTYELYTKDTHWQAQVDRMKNDYLPQRSAIVLNQFKEANYLPEIAAPVFSSEGGDFDVPVDLTMTAESGTIYYTTDDTDPRLFGGAVGANGVLEYTESIAVYQDVIIKARVKNGNAWSALTRAKFDIKAFAKTISETICEGDAFHGFTETGTHYLEEKTKTGADSVVEIHLTVNSLPAISLGEDQTLTQGDELTLESNATFESYLWSTGETTKSIKVAGSQLGETSYWLQVQDSNGCVNTDTVTIQVVEKPLGLNESYSNAINIYPNPTTDRIHIEFAQPGTSEVLIEITDLSGKRVFQNQLKSASVSEEINLSFLTKGVYILKIRTAEFEKTVEVIKK